jgi:hypothetical protein
MIRSRSFVFSDFTSDWYKRWARALKQDKNHLGGYALKANKFWQNAIMAQILEEKEILQPGKAGIGFGVGQERLPALFASKGVEVTATDQDFRTDKAKHWQKHELAHDAHSLNTLLICEPRLFGKNMSFQAIDMTKIPKKLFEKYDFAWSNCALGHLGSIDAGLEFIVNSAHCLKPGGWAVHTTEVNVLSNTATVDSGDTVIFRPKDVYRLSKKLAKAGFRLEPLRLNFGTSKDDLKVAMHPQYGNDYSKIHFRGHLITQVVLIVHKPKKPSKRQLSSYNQRHRYYYLRNVLAQVSFKNKTLFLKNMKALKKSVLPSNGIRPIKNELNVNLKKKSNFIFIEFENNSDKPVFSLEHRTDDAWPIALTTAGPFDRKSIFKADDWFNDQANRPSAQIFKKNKKTGWSEVKKVQSGSRFAFRVKLDPKQAKKGTYSEKMSIVQEGCQHLASTVVTLNINIT